MPISRIAARFSAAVLARRWSDLIGRIEDGTGSPSSDKNRDWDADRRKRHEPEVQRLSMLLGDWGPCYASESKTTEQLHENLLAMDECAKYWRTVHRPILYRAFLPTKEQSNALRDTGRCVLYTPLEKPLVTWSKCLFGAFEWIADCPHPWVIFSHKTTDLNVFLDFGTFYSDVMSEDSRFEEVIVEMPPKMTISRAAIPLTRDIDWITHTGPNPRGAPSWMI